MSKTLHELEREWYERLKKEGFEDIEDHTYPDKPLKRWSGAHGVGIVDAVKHQEANEPHQSSFPDKRFAKEERLLNHADFDEICRLICGHGNHKLTAELVRAIFEKYVDGDTNREIAEALGINHVSVFRCIEKLRNWSESLGEEPEVTTVIVRAYDSERDAAMLFSTWRNSLWFDTPGRDESLNHKFFRDCTRLIKTILAHDDARVEIACLSDDPNLILGAAVFNSDNLVWIYVKADYRGRGIATLLAKEAKTVSNPSTRIGKAIVKEKNLKVKDE
jgi:GNAT superfamily N-acetyltransferase